MWDTLFGWLPKLIRAILPARDPSETDRHYHWRCTVTGAILVIFAGSTFCGLASYGWFAPYYEGFAQASTLQHTDETLDQLLDDSIRTAVDKNKAVECKALLDHNGAILGYAVRAKQDAEARWYVAHQKPYPYEPSCQELIN